MGLEGIRFVEGGAWDSGRFVEDAERKGMTLIQGPSIVNWHTSPRKYDFSDLLRDGWILEPLIITPVLNKNLHGNPLRQI